MGRTTHRAARPHRFGLSRAGHALPVVENEREHQRPGMSGLRLCLPANPDELRTIRRRVDHWAEHHQLPEEVVIDLQLALGEAVANGMEHAYRRGGQGTVEVDLEIRGQGAARVVAVQVADHGRWRPRPLLSGYRGRGLALIGKLADRLAVAATVSGTTVCFEIPLSARREGPRCGGHPSGEP